MFAGFEFLTTFIFVFGVVYGLLILADIFGKEQKKVNAIIALAFGLFSASYTPVVEFIQVFLPYATAILIVLFFLAFVKLIIFGRGKKDSNKTDPVILLVMLIIVIVFIAAAGSSGWLIKWLPIMASIDMNNIMWGVGLLLIAAILYIAYDRGTSGDTEKKKN